MKLVAVILAVFATAVPAAPADAAAEGQVTWALHISLAPTWFDPAETPGIGTPFLVLYALHDAMVKPMPGNAAAPSLAESWSASKDGLVYEFVLRQGARFHNGDPVTADDVKFSFERYRGAASKLLKERVAGVEVLDAQRLRFRLTLGFSRITWSIIPQTFDFFWQPPAYPYDPAKAKQLLAEAGYPKGFDAGDLWCDAAASTMSEATAGFLQAVGIRAKVRPLERAAFVKSYQEKTLKNIVYSLSGAFGNAATRLETFVASGGPYVYGSSADIDGLFREQAGELDRKRREAMLHRIQQLVHEKVLYAPIWELGFIHAQGPRVAESALGAIPGWAFSAPYEDVKLKAR